MARISFLLLVYVGSSFASSADSLVVPEERLQTEQCIDDICYLADNEQVRIHPELLSLGIVLQANGIDQIGDRSEDIAILDLSHNSWTSEIFTAFTAEVKRRNLNFGNLQCLFVTYNRISQEAAQAFAF